MKISFVRVIVGLVLVVSGCERPGSATKDSAANLATDNATAKQIITQMAGAYGACKSYCDTGMVKTIFFTDDDTSIDKKPFTTAFVRPDRLRFEYSFTHPIPGSQPKRHIVWAKGKDVRVWWDLEPGIQKKASLNVALGGATGASSGSAHTIPKLLMPEEIEGAGVAELHQLRRMADTLLEDVACYRIEGKHKASDGEPMTLWISKQTFLIHRIDSSYKFDDFRTEETTTYEPQVDVAIDESKLAFNAPEKSRE